MSHTHHYLKTIEPFWSDVYHKKKCFELRKNDRHFEVGDYVHLQKWDDYTKVYGGCIHATITYIVNDARFCKDGFVAFQIEVFDQ